MTEDKETMFYQSFDIVSINGAIKRKTGYGIKYIAYDGSGSAKTTRYVDNTKNAMMKNVNKLYTSKNSNVHQCTWSGSNPNVFSDYNTAMAQNHVIVSNLYENTISMKINSLTDVKLLDKIHAKIPSFSDSGNSINEVLSGEYLVVGIVHSLSYGGPYEKRILLSRRGLNISKDRNGYDVE